LFPCEKKKKKKKKKNTNKKKKKKTTLPSQNKIKPKKKKRKKNQIKSKKKMSDFASYDWEGDAAWRAYLENVTVAPDPDPRVVERLRHKYFRRHVDPEHEVPAPGAAKATDAPSAAAAAGGSSSSGGGSGTHSNQPRDSPPAQGPPPPQAQAKAAGPTGSAKAAAGSAARLRPQLPARLFPVLHATIVLAAAAYLVLGSGLAYNASMGAFAVACVAASVAELGLPQVFGQGSVRGGGYCICKEKMYNL
jgi:hypothetical protein